MCGRLANLREFGCDLHKFWETRARQEEHNAIVRDECWCTHVCFIHDSLRHSPKVLLYDIPVTYLESKFSNLPDSGAARPQAPRVATEGAH